MKKLTRMLANICSDKFDESILFYTKLFDFTVDYDSDWFVHLISQENQLELGIISKKSEIIPKSAQGNPQGFYITFVVDSADEIYEIAKAEKFHILSEPSDTFYGQRRMLLQDPNGVVVDVSSPIPDFKF